MKDDERDEFDEDVVPQKSSKSFDINEGVDGEGEDFEEEDEVEGKDPDDEEDEEE